MKSQVEIAYNINSCTAVICNRLYYSKETYPRLYKKCTKARPWENIHFFKHNVHQNGLCPLFFFAIISICDHQT